MLDEIQSLITTELEHTPGKSYRNMTRESAEHLVEHVVYTATRIIENLEMAGKLHGNGHHMRQKLASIAKKMVHNRWIDQRAEVKYCEECGGEIPKECDGYCEEEN